MSQKIWGHVLNILETLYWRFAFGKRVTYLELDSASYRLTVKFGLT